MGNVFSSAPPAPAAPVRDLEAEALEKMKNMNLTVSYATDYFIEKWSRSMDANDYPDGFSTAGAALHCCDEAASGIHHIVNEPEYTGKWKDANFNQVYYALQMQAREAYMTSCFLRAAGICEQHAR